MGLSRAPHERTFGLFSACPMISRSVRLSAGPMRDAPHVCAQSEVRARLPVQRGQPPGAQWPARASQEVRVTGKLVPLVRLREPGRTAETGSGDRHPAAEATSNSRRRRARPGRGRDERLLQRPTHDCAGKPRREAARTAVTLWGSGPPARHEVCPEPRRDVVLEALAERRFPTCAVASKVVDETRLQACHRRPGGRERLASEVRRCRRPEGITLSVLGEREEPRSPWTAGLSS
jgi:hypothetical protein